MSLSITFCKLLHTDGVTLLQSYCWSLLLFLFCCRICFRWDVRESVNGSKTSVIYLQTFINHWYSVSNGEYWLKFILTFIW